MTRERMSDTERHAVEAYLEGLVQGVRELAERLDGLKAELREPQLTASAPTGSGSAGSTRRGVVHSSQGAGVRPEAVTTSLQMRGEPFSPAP
jgi:hypothetical protein